MEELDLGVNLTYSERPVKILDTAERVTRSKIIKICNVQWSHHTKDEATWEHVIPCSEKEGTKPPYVCPGCSNHTYSNNMITRIHVQ
jgi:hypothetical protein